MANPEPLGPLAGLALRLRHGAPGSAPVHWLVALLSIALIGGAAHTALVQPLSAERDRLRQQLDQPRDAPVPTPAETRAIDVDPAQRVDGHGRVLDRERRASGEQRLTVATDHRRVAALLAAWSRPPGAGRPVALHLESGEGPESLRVTLRLKPDERAGSERPGEGSRPGEGGRPQAPSTAWPDLPPTLFFGARQRPALAADDLHLVGVVRRAEGEFRALIVADDGRLRDRAEGERLGTWVVERVAADFVALRRPAGSASGPDWMRLGLGEGAD